ncbi:MAG: peptide deformylase [Rickettsiales bacterium]|nr:MAG: peptide deformylase [Rickettsiales bacterium]
MKLEFFENGLITEMSKKVEVFDNKLAQNVNSMFVILHKHKGIGLAAIQVGIPIRVIIAEVDNVKLIAINPEFVEKSAEVSEYEEGNLSIPNVKAKITRPAKIKIKYQNLRGVWQELEASGLLATCIQHEMEQMDGISILKR